MYGGGGGGFGGAPPEGVPPAAGGQGWGSMYDVPGAAGSEMEEIATAVGNVDYTGQDYGAALGGYAETRSFTETSEKVGWIWKKGGSKEKSKAMIMLEGRRKNWTRRYFVMEGTNLLYYISPNDRSMGIPEKGQIVLNDFVIRPDAEDAKPGTFGFALASSNRVFELACESEAERDSWITFLQGVLDKVAGKVLVSSASVDAATAHYRAGNGHLVDGNDMFAVQEYTAAIGLNPAYEDAYYNRGIAYLNTGQNQKLAITDFTQVIQMNSTCASAYNNRGIAYKQDGKTELAIADYRTCLQLEPSDEYAQKNLLMCEEELRSKGGSVAMPLGHDYQGYVYRQTPSHFFSKRFLTLQGGVLADKMEDS